ncbi:MAG TPA: methyl-accepting chemotaxis protein, partial [Spirochaetota bacterium]|nr:methyl-accepting chemotaxis protein [Spirochaetota bacterium]
MSDLTPGSEEDFIRQLQEQLANESGNSNLSNEKSSFDFNPSEIEDIKTINEGENISQSKDNKSAKNKNVKQKDINKEKSNLYIFLDVVEIFGFPLVLLGGIFLLNYFLKDLIIGIVSSLIGSLLIGGYIKLLINLKLSESYKTSEEILNEIGKGKLSFDILNDEALKKRLGKLAEPIDKVVKEMSDMVTKMELSVLDIVGNSDALAYFATSMANKTDQQEDSIIRIDNSTKKLDESMQNVKSNVDSAYSISKNSIKEADNSSIEILSLIQEMHTINDMSDKILTTMNF